MRRSALIAFGLLTMAMLMAALAAGRSQAASSPRVKVVTSSHYYIGTTSLRVIGLVQNTTGTPQQNVNVFVSVYDRKRKLVGGNTGAPKLTIILPHATAPFDIEVAGVPSSISAVTFKVTSDPVGDLVHILSQQVTSSTSTSATVSGSIENISHSRVYVSSVTGAAFDASGHIVDVSADTYGGLPTLQPGAIGTYSLSFARASGSSRFQVYAQATPSS